MLHHAFELLQPPLRLKSMARLACKFFSLQAEQGCVAFDKVNVEHIAGQVVGTPLLQGIQIAMPDLQLLGAVLQGELLLLALLTQKLSER